MSVRVLFVAVGMLLALPSWADHHDEESKDDVADPADAKAEAKAEAKPEAKADAKPEAKAKPDAQPEEKASKSGAALAAGIGAGVANAGAYTALMLVALVSAVYLGPFAILIPVVGVPIAVAVGAYATGTIMGLEAGDAISITIGSLVGHYGGLVLGGVAGAVPGLLLLSGSSGGFDGLGALLLAGAGILVGGGIGGSIGSAAGATVMGTVLSISEKE